MSLGFASVAGPTDRTARLFAPTFRDEFLAATHRMRPDAVISVGEHTSVEQSRLLGFHVAPGGDAWGISADWNGGVGLVRAVDEITGELSWPVRLIRAAWTEAVTLADALGRYGPARLHVTVTVPHRPRNRGYFIVRIQRPTEVRPPTESELMSVERELRRAAGEAAWEPEAGESK